MERSQWDGSDFFIVWPLPNYFLVTSKVAEVLASNKLKRCQVIPLGEVKFGTIHVFGIGFSPGRLRHYFSDKRAKQIGEPLGIY